MRTHRVRSPARGPSTSCSPYFCPKSGERNADPKITLSMPSMVQNRPIAKGRSMDTHMMATLSRLAASWLKRRTEVAQTGVSRLGKMLRTTRLSAKSEHSICERSGAVRW